MMIEVIFTIIIGLAGGLAVGSGFVAFLTALGIVPRLTQLSKTNKYIRIYEWGVIFGALTGSWFSLHMPIFHFSELILIPIGLAAGTFIGALAAALAEVLNVFPILAKRLGVDEKIIFLLMSIVLGKICGSLFHWIYFVDK